MTDKICHNPHSPATKLIIYVLDGPPPRQDLRDVAVLRIELQIDLSSQDNRRAGKFLVPGASSAPDCITDQDGWDHSQDYVL